MILTTMKNNLIEAGLWMDDMIYSLISLVYSLINKLAQYQVFTSEDITSFSRRVYILLGIFMLFKLTFSMITYLVNPDQFSDKSKGFGGMIKNVMISMVLMVAVPYIFSEAYYVQKMILEDGTLIKVIFPKGGEAGSNASYGYVNDTAGEDIKFILFSQFIKPNTNIVACKTLYEYDDKGERLVNEDGVLAIDEECKSALDEAFDKQELLNFYVDGMTYQSYDLLTSEPEIYTKTFKTTDKRGKTVKKEVITYHWLISTIVGIVTLLALTTICLDVALRSIKLGLYQIIAPIPIISNCDPKAGKDGMLQKWIKACVSTYVDLFIRLFILYLGLYIIITLVNNIKFDGIASVILIIGVLMFAKQCPKIIQDLTGLKIEGFTLNPFKKISNEALLPDKVGKAIGKVGVSSLMGLGLGAGKTLAMKLSSGIDAAKHGKGFANGFNSVHGKLGASIDKMRQNWKPYSYADAKAVKEAKEQDKLDQKRNILGEKYYDKTTRKMDEKTFGKELKRVDPTYHQSWENTNKKKTDMFKAQARNEAWKQAIFNKTITKDQRENLIKSLGLDSNVDDSKIIQMLDKNSNTYKKQYEEANRKHINLGKLNAHSKAFEMQSAFDYYKDTNELLQEIAEYRDERFDNSNVNGVIVNNSNGEMVTPGGIVIPEGSRTYRNNSTNVPPMNNNSVNNNSTGGSAGNNSSSSNSTVNNSSSNDSTVNNSSSNDSTANNSSNNTQQVINNLEEKNILLGKKNSLLSDIREIENQINQLEKELNNASNSYDKDRINKKIMDLNNELIALNEELIDIEKKLENM